MPGKAGWRRIEADRIINKDCFLALKEMPDESVHCCVTSPPYYGLRDYGMDGQVGREATPEQYIGKLAEIFSEVYRVLRADGTCWLNISDTYCGTGSKGGCKVPKNPEGRNGQNISIAQNVEGCKHKDLIGIPWMLAFALRNSGRYLRNDIVWQKGNAMPESAKDRLTRSYEHIFLLAKSQKYYFDAAAIAEPIAADTARRYMAGRGSRHKYSGEVPGQAGVQKLNKPRKAGEIKESDISPVRNCRDVWLINTVPYRGKHFAAYPPKLAERCILAGCPEGGIVLDPFFGSGTTGLVAVQNNRHYIGIELNGEYCALAEERKPAMFNLYYLYSNTKEVSLKIGLVDVDGHNFPNLCLMKLSAYHKARGDTVEWYDSGKWYDLVYMSRVFTDTYSKDYEGSINACHVIKGGTGYGLDNKLPDAVEHTRPNYGLYPQFAGTAYGFLSRGCPRGCGFCIVGEKEGRKTAAVADLSEFWGGEKEIKLLDANILACPDWERLLGQLADSGATVDFTQGLDVRLVTPEKAAALNKINTKMLHFAWDNPEDDLTPYFKKFLELTTVKDKRKRRVYVLTNYGSTHEQDLYRIYALRDMGYDPYVMVYEKPTAPEETKKMQRWVNNKWLFHSVKDFKDYDPRGYRKAQAPDNG